MNSYGDKFRISIFGESHGELIGLVMDGAPEGIALSVDDFLPDLARRKSGAKGTTPRIESDLPEIVSGVYQGYTTGAPITVVFKNNNTKSHDYSAFRETPRPGHADFVASIKYNSFNDIRGGGHFSGRLTLCLVAAGVVAKKLIGGISIKANIVEIGGQVASPELHSTGMPVNWVDILDTAIENEDSVGGLIECVCTRVPIGLGSPFFESLESKIAQLVFSIPATRGVEFGDGFAAASMLGSQHNDCYIDSKGTTLTNGAGGINGGISNGNPIIFRVAIKPTPSISRTQNSYNFATDCIEAIKVKGRHDCCIALRTPVIIEAIAAIALANT